MKINIGNPQTGLNKKFVIDDDVKLKIFMEQRIASEIDLTPLGPEFEGYIVKITGGCDKDGFPMMQGVLTNRRQRLLLDGTRGCFKPLRSGDRRKKTIRGCIVAGDIGVLNCVLLKKGKNEIPDLTDRNVPRKLGPKRASNIRKLFHLEKHEDPRPYVISKKVMKKDGTFRGFKKPKIQRLVTPKRLERKKRIMSDKKKRWLKAKQAAVEYVKLVREVKAEKREENAKKIAKLKEAEMKKKIGDASKAKATAQLAKHLALKKLKKLRLKAEKKKAKLIAKKTAKSKGKKSAAKAKIVIKPAAKKAEKPIVAKPHPKKDQKMPAKKPVAQPAAKAPSKEPVAKAPATKAPAVKTKDVKQPKKVSVKKTVTKKPVAKEAPKPTLKKAKPAEKQAAKALKPTPKKDSKPAKKPSKPATKKSAKPAAKQPAKPSQPATKKAAPATKPTAAPKKPAAKSTAKATPKKATSKPPAIKTKPQRNRS